MRTRSLRPPDPWRSLRGALRLAALAAALLAGTPSPATDSATRDIGGWTLAASSDGEGCFLTRTYPRATTLLFGLDVDGANRLTLLNANWSIAAKDRLRLNFRLSNASFPRHLAVGLAADGGKGFVTSFGAAFPATFAAAKFLHVTRGDVPVEELALDGSGAAIAELRKCVDRHRRLSAAPSPAKADADRIPLDPFAVKTERKTRK